MTHLGTQISALADGQLGPAATERALAHVAVCPQCAAELEVARSARRSVAAAFEVHPTADLTARLLALGVGAPPAAEPERRDLPAGGSVPLPGTSPRLPTGCLRGDLTQRWNVPWTAVAVAGAGLGLAAVVLFALGAQTPVSPERHPAHVLSVLGRAGAAVAAQEGQQARTAGPADALGTAVLAGSTAQFQRTVDPGLAVVEVVGPETYPAVGAEDPAVQVESWLAEHPWAAPVTVPDGYRVAAVRFDPDGQEGLEVDLAGSYGLIVVTQAHGRLDPAALPPALVVAGRDVHVLSDAPWHVVWQSGDAVVSVAAEVRTVVAEDVVGSYPAHAYDDGVPARIARGWQVLAGVWSTREQ